MQVSTLYNILCAVHSLHVHRVVHCDLHPIQFGWFNESQQWKLLGVSSWAHTGSARSSNMTYTLRYAAPEVTEPLQVLHFINMRDSVSTTPVEHIAHGAAVVKQ